MRCLENWIVVDIVGSKRKVKKDKIYTFSALRDAGYGDKLANKISLGAMEWLEFYKEFGDYVAHTVHMGTKDQVLVAMADTDDSNEDMADKKSLVELLDNYCHTQGVPFGANPIVKPPKTTTRHGCHATSSATQSTSGEGAMQPNHTHT